MKIMCKLLTLHENYSKLVKYCRNVVKHWKNYWNGTETFYKVEKMDENGLEIDETSIKMTQKQMKFYESL